MSDMKKIRPTNILNVPAVRAEFDRLRDLGLTYEHIAKSLSAKFDARITKNMCVGWAWRLRQTQKQFPQAAE